MQPTLQFEMETYWLTILPFLFLYFKSTTQCATAELKFQIHRLHGFNRIFNGFRIGAPQAVYPFCGIKHVYLGSLSFPLTIQHPCFNKNVVIFLMAASALRV